MTTKQENAIKVVLEHRRGRVDNFEKEFRDEKSARKYAEENHLLIVHEDQDDQGHQRLYYLPE